AHVLKSNSSNLKVILEMPEQHWDVVQSTDKLVLKSFTPIEIKPLAGNDVKDILDHHIPKMEAYHGIKVSPELREYLIKKTDKFMPNDHQPAKSLKVIANVLASAEADGKTELVEDDFDTVIAQHAKLPKSFVGSDSSVKIETLGPALLERIFGQDAQINQIAGTIGLVNDGMHDPKKPLAVFYLTGSTGVGKTEIARAIAAHLFGDEEAVIRVDLGQYHDKHTMARLVGSPPGYVGYGDKGELDEVQKRPFSVVLFDEAEKSHPDIDNALLPILDEGKLTKMDGKKLNFKNCVIILTSNLGARDAEIAAARKKMGFGSAAKDNSQNMANAIQAEDAAIKARLKPEFRGRTKLIRLNNLDRSVAERIALKKIREVSARLQDNNRYKNLKIELSPTALQQIVDIGYHPLTGARPMRDAIENHVQLPLRAWLKENIDSITNQKVTLVVESVKDQNEKGEFKITPQLPPAPPRLSLPAPGLV
ncbi:MAG TPA: AAA family ATPase, partial [Micavibrio sp.]